ncbi:MAG TPA: efflux RND transporter permease subunit, partial [Phycisphaerae bacterium]|nr:efflux RND transporter permease subunit [Phycisphaerae bacterium]
LTGVNGLKELRSTSAEGISTIVAEFHPDVDIDDALQRVKDKVDLAKKQLPPEAEEPLVTEINVAEMPIMMINISGPISPVRLKAIAEELEDRIESIPGVLGVDILGALEREIRVEPDPDRLAAYGLTLEELLRLIPSENVNISAGGLETEGTKFNIRVPAEFVKADEVDQLLLTVRNGRPIYLSDVARVRDTYKDRLSYSRLDGRSSITVAVRKRVGENIVAIAQVVKRILEQARTQLPKGVEFALVMDQSDDIHMMVADLENNIVTALILVVAVLILFMGLRTSMIVAMAIPLSMLMSFAILHAMGITLNMIVLFSLILALGMLVDNAIVIVENVYRHREMGYGPVQAAMKGTGEVAWPVITSTATTLAAFSPLLFWPGIMGDFMSYLPMTVMIVLSSSLFVALVISPVICSVTLRRIPARQAANGEHWFVRGYRRLLNAALAHRVTALLLAVLILAGVGTVYMKRKAGVELFPDIDPREAVINIRSPQGTNIRESERLAGLVEAQVEKYRRSPSGGADRIKHVVNNVGAGTGNVLFSGEAGPHMANLTVIFPDFEDRRQPSTTMVKEIRESLTGVTGAEVKVEKQREGPPTGAPVTVRIVGEDLGELERISTQAMDLIRDVPNLVNLRSDLEAARPELSFRVDRERAMYLGVNTTVVGQFLKMAVLGTKVSDFRQFTEEYDITIRLPESQRMRIEDLLRLRVPNHRGESIPLSSLGRFVYWPGLGTIHRVNQKRVVTLTADAEGRLGTAVLAGVQNRLRPLAQALSPGYEIRYAGQKEFEDEARQFLSKAFVLAILLIVGILVAQFNTLSVPLIIMTTVILSTIGVFVGLLALNLPFGIIMTGVGVISLAGVVVNNAIVLLDYTRKLQRQGMDLISATIQAGVTRLRPVLLTATTTILGLVPMVVGVSFDVHTLGISWRSESSQWWRSMATAVIFGLTFATLLTLVVVPSLYVMLYRLAAHFGLGGIKKPDDEQEAPQGEPATG